ncbi:hypothetical protein CDAR_104591, partial [Caerostris darwini]
LSCTQSYFVSELSWCPEGDLQGARDVELQVCTLGSPLESSEAEGDSQVTPSTGFRIGKQFPVQQENLF